MERINRGLHSRPRGRYRLGVGGVRATDVNAHTYTQGKYTVRYGETSSLRSDVRFSFLVIGGNEARPQCCSSQSAMHHGVRVRVFFRRSTYWSHLVHFFLILLVFVPGTFLRVHNIHHTAFARELEGKKKHRAGPTSSSAVQASSSSNRSRSSKICRKRGRTYA